MPEQLGKRRLSRHTGAGWYPAIKNSPRSGQNHDAVPLAWEIFNHLDSGLAEGQFILSLSKGRNDGLMDYPGLKKQKIPKLGIQTAGILEYGIKLH